MRPVPRGFGLIELLVVLVVIAILAAVALPAYRDNVLKNRRKDAIAALGKVQIEQERYRGTASTYGTLAQLKLPATSQERWYTISVDTVSATAFTATATATGDQAADTACATLVVTQAGPLIDTAPRKACWAQ
jgi:type IV pilus assembly protein PilE